MSELPSSPPTPPLREGGAEDAVSHFMNEMIVRTQPSGEALLLMHGMSPGLQQFDSHLDAELFQARLTLLMPLESTNALNHRPGHSINLIWNY